MLIHVLASFGEFERGRIGVRTSDVLAFDPRSGTVWHANRVRRAALQDDH